MLDSKFHFSNQNFNSQSQIVIIRFFGSKFRFSNQYLYIGSKLESQNEISIFES